MKYTVKMGDNLYKIAQYFKVAFAELVKANPHLADPDLVNPGQVIEIPVEEVKPPVISGEVPDFQNSWTGMTQGFMPPGAWAPYGFSPGVSGIPAGFPPRSWAASGGAFDRKPPFAPTIPFSGMPGMMPGFPGAQMKAGMYGPAAEKQAAKQGDKGQHIQYLQARLKEMGYYKGAVTGRFGPKTKYAVKKFQRDCNMQENGIVDQYFWASIGWY